MILYVDNTNIKIKIIGNYFFLTEISRNYNIFNSNMYNIIFSVILKKIRY